MKAAVLKTFQDKHTGAVYAPGEVLTLDQVRFSEILEKLGSSYIAAIVDPDAILEPKEQNGGDIPGTGDAGLNSPAELKDSRPVLSELAVGSLSLTPAFTPSITSYTAQTANNTNKVRAVAADDTALIRVSINGETVPNESSVAWSEGENTLTVSVAVDGGGYTDYTVIVTKE